MPAEKFAAWLERHSAEYVRERMAAGDSAEYANERATESNAQYFPDGAPAEGQLVFEVVTGDGEFVGVLWIGPMSPRHPQEWWVFDIEIDEAYRGRGVGRETMLLAETEARAHGAVKLGLNVFGHNTVAQRLYTSLGYETTAITMAKPL
ncbi:GNAT family N-acetyltransferase [Herbiconiux sp. CPCC 205763]|uniref:GNAT family N-acetyltransferase n=1 Tax=Herbiconiux aconitum TaxID=2970913 RepID=A0ABT2GNZ2_9MICO|nr:GNAT family N-acetyltransferase [Herbiconiux aconitum]MCS5717942.1 GNAT family N-acetyltransferase [Herbiconiux aconitum]